MESQEKKKWVDVVLSGFMWVADGSRVKNKWKDVEAGGRKRKDVENETTGPRTNLGDFNMR